MEFSIAELVAIGALILNVIVYFSRVPTRKDLSDLRSELRDEIRDIRSKIGELRSEMNVRFSKLDEAFTNHLMFMHGDSRQPPPQGDTE